MQATTDTMGEGRKSGRPRSEKSRRAILDATIELLGHEALSDITIASIAEKAGVGKATIYRWWPSRTALVLEAMEDLPPLIASDTGDLVSDLTAIARQLSESLVSSPLGRVLAHFAANRTAQTDPDVREYFNARIGTVSQVFERAVERGEFPLVPDNSVLIHITLGAVINRVFFGAEPPDEEFIELAVRTVVGGFPAAVAAREHDA